MEDREQVNTDNCRDLVARIQRRRAKKRRLSEHTFPPITAEQLEAAERAIGFPLPEGLRCIHRYIGYGELGLPCYFSPLTPAVVPPHRDCEFMSIREHYQLCKRGDVVPTPANSMADWPEGVLPFCEWYDTYSCIDCTKEGFPVLVHDPFFVYHLYPHKATFDEWLEDILTGKDIRAEMQERYVAFVASLKDDLRPPDETSPPPTDADWEWLHSAILTASDLPTE